MEKFKPVQWLNPYTPNCLASVESFCMKNIGSTSQHKLNFNKINALSGTKTIYQLNYLQNK